MSEEPQKGEKYPPMTRCKKDGHRYVWNAEVYGMCENCEEDCENKGQPRPYDLDHVKARERFEVRWNINPPTKPEEE